MVYKKKTPVTLQESDSEGEDFSDNSASSKASGIEDPVDDGWVFPIVLPKAPRAEYEAVCELFTSSSIFNFELTTFTVSGTQRGPIKSK
jgi:hypothetical protein